MAPAAETFLQSEWWSRFKGEFGWRALAHEGPAGRVMLLWRRVGPILFGYSPHAFARREDLAGAAPGPGGAERPDAAALLETLRGAADAAPRPALLRWDVPWPLEDAPALPGVLRPAPVRVQPPDTVILDLTAGADACLEAMKSKTRYNIRLAQRKGVRVERYPGDRALAQLDAWDRLNRATAARDRITTHPPPYYRRLFTLARETLAGGDEAPQPALLIARHEGDLLGAIITLSWRGVTTYLYGASADTKRNLMANYLVQWRAIEAAIEHGDHSYDLFGIPPTDDPAHPMHGLYRFKTGFGGRVVHRIGARDLVLRPLLAGGWRSGERVRAWYFHSWRKRGRGGT